MPAVRRGRSVRRMHERGPVSAASAAAEYRSVKPPIFVAVDQDIVDLAENFLRNRRGEVQDAHAAVAICDLGALRRIGHALKGTAGSFGFRDLSAVGADLEAATIAGDLTGATDAVERLSELLARIWIVPR